MRKICRYLPILSLVPFCVSLASAQNAVDVGIGFGGAWDSAANSASATASGIVSPALSAFMLGFSGDVMFKPKFGFGASYAVQPAKQNYGSAITGAEAESFCGAPCTVQYQDRLSFIDFNGVYRPIQTKRAALNIEGGIGAARTSASENITQSGSQCAGLCPPAQSSPINSYNHFDVHVGIGAEIFVTEHLFIRPQLDMHFVNGLANQTNGSVTFGSGFVPTAMVWVGYNLGSK